MSELDRVTLNLVPRSAEALADAMRLTGDNKTDCVNKALPVYAYIEQVLANGGRILVQESPQEELIRIMIF